MRGKHKCYISSQIYSIGACAALVWGINGQAIAQDSAADIAKKLNNPVAAMISVPFQFNYDEDLGPTEEGKRTLLNIQPVIPFLTDDGT